MNIKVILVFISVVCLVSCKNATKTKTIDKDINEEQSIDALQKYPTTGTIERLAPELDAIISKNARIDVLAEGFNWSEGPVWSQKEQRLLFSDVPENKVYQWNEEEGLSVYLEPSGYTGAEPRSGGKGSNGLAINNNGDLILCQHGDRAISKLVNLKDGANPIFEQIVTHYKGKKFNSPNDLVFDSHGNMYFTDPPYGLPSDDLGEIGMNGVYFYNTEDGITLIDGELARPNGVVLSHNGKTLYVAESNIPKPLIWAYDVIKEGAVANKRVFFDPGDIINKSLFKQNPDGIKLDKDGNIFVAAGDGVLIITPEGKHIGTINTGRLTGNCEFTDDWKFLFITADDYLIRVNLKPNSK